MNKRVFSIIFLALLVTMMLMGCSASTEEKGKAAEVITETQPQVETTEETMSVPDLAEYVQERTVTITATLADGTSTGSGFFIDDQGTVVTSYHVIDGAEEISVEVMDGGKYDVKKIVDLDHIHDVAVLQINYSGNKYLKISDKAPRVGENAYAVGSSLGFLEGTFSNGVVSTASRNLGIIECVQTTAAISNGNSGGPLVNEKGEVIGINAFVYESGENLNLAVAIGILNELEMDKNWSVSQFREWYKKEISRSYPVWNYTTEEWEVSKINTYQHITERSCSLSALDWDFTGGDVSNVVEGYRDDYGIYLYEYHVDEFDKYTDYLNRIGFTFTKSEDFTEGTSYYYENEFTGFKVDVFVMDGEEIIAVEAYNN